MASKQSQGSCGTDEETQTEVSAEDMKECFADEEFEIRRDSSKEMPEQEPRNTLEAFMQAVGRAVQAPGIWVREKIVEPNRQKYPWYHQKFRRVPTIDECYTDDWVCYHEANCQYKRDRLVDSEIVAVLRSRFEDCVAYETPDHVEKCTPLWDQYKEAELNWFIKYGDLGGYHDVKAAYMKQKHRMLWERRYGPVGTGMQDRNVKEKGPCDPEEL